MNLYLKQQSFNQYYKCNWFNGDSTGDVSLKKDIFREIIPESFEISELKQETCGNSIIEAEKK